MDDHSIVALVGGIFLVVGIIFLAWGFRERRGYLDSLVQRRDMREFLTRWPERWWLNTLMVGGWVGLSLGVILLILGLVFWLS